MPEPDNKKPETEKKTAKVKDLPPKNVKTDSAGNVKGGVAGPCDSPRRRQ